MVKARLILAAAMTLALTGNASAQSVAELYEAGVKARVEQRFDEAIDLLQRAVALQPGNSDALVQLGLARLATDDLDGAGDAFNRALAIAPGYHDARVGLARIAWRKGDLDGARGYAEQVLAAQPGNADAQEILAAINKAQAAATPPSPPPAPKARKATPKIEAKRPRPDPTDAMMARARNLRMRAQFAEAEVVYRAVLKRHPQNVDALVALGLTVGSQQRFDEAAALYEQALVIDPQSVDAQLARVRLAMWRGDVGGARKLLSGASALTAGHQEAAGLDARITLLEGDYDLAEQKFQTLIEANPEDVEALVGLGDVRRARGDEDAALETYKRASVIDPVSKDIKDRLSVKPPPRWRLDIGGEVSALSGGRANWTDSSMALAYRFAPQTWGSLRTRLATRGNTVDTQLEARLDHSFQPGFSAYSLVAVTPDANFLADFSVGGGASWRVVDQAGEIGPITANVDARYDVFDGEDVWTIAPWMQVHLLDERLALSGRWVHAQDTGGARADGYVVRADALVTERLKIHVGYADVPEISEGTLVPTQSFFGGVSVDLNERITLRGDYAHEERPAFDRDTFGLGVSFRF